VDVVVEGLAEELEVVRYRSVSAHRDISQRT
jgi:hypothetical protein